MKIFRLEWADYDCYSSWLFSHENKTQEQFNEDVESLLRKYGNEYIDNESSWTSSNKWIEYISDKLPELGYQTIEPIDWYFFGGYILHNEDVMDKEDKKWSKLVGDELMEKCKLHNQKIREEMDGCVKKRQSDE